MQYASSAEAGALTLLMLQKMRRRRTQKKTAMTPVPMRITISMLPLSSEPEWAKVCVCMCVRARGRGWPRSDPSRWRGSREVTTRGHPGGAEVGVGLTFHSHAGGGVHAAFGVAHAAQVAASVLLAHALDAELLVRVCQVDSCRGGGRGTRAGDWRSAGLAGLLPMAWRAVLTRLFLQQLFVFVPHDAGHMCTRHGAPHLQGVAHVHQEVGQVLHEPGGFQGWGQG